jgi:hypothetical protein
MRTYRRRISTTAVATPRSSSTDMDASAETEATEDDDETGPVAAAAVDND